MSHFIIPVFIPNYGCPDRCIFCDQKKTGGSAEILPDVKSEIIIWLKRKKPSSFKAEVAFYGGSFTALPVNRQKQLLEQAYGFIRSGDIHSIRVSTRPDKISVKALQLLKEYRVNTVEIGVQSMDSAVLAKSFRGYGAGEVVDAFALLRDFGFKTGAQLMPGLPGDTPVKNMKTARSVASLRPDFARIYPVLVIKGTPLEQMYRKGEYSPLSIEDAVEWSSVMFSVFRENGIDVIRMGLQASELLDSGNVIVSGPYHPAFGQLVKSALALSAMRELIKKRENLPAGKIVIHVPPGEVSDFVGQKRENILKLKAETGRDILIKASGQAGNGAEPFLTER